MEIKEKLLDLKIDKFIKFREHLEEMQAEYAPEEINILLDWCNKTLQDAYAEQKQLFEEACLWADALCEAEVSHDWPDYEL